MTISQLSVIALTCPAGHSFTTRARGGITVRCPECGKAKRVPKDRAGAALAIRTRPAVAERDQAADAGMAARWKAEREWDGKSSAAGAGPDDECPECGGPVVWEPGRTAILCKPCNRLGLPGAVAGHYERERARSSAVAVRSAAVAKPVTAADRAELRARKSVQRGKVENWINGIGDPDCYDRVQFQRQAAEFAALLHGWLPEIDGAATAAELAAIVASLDELLTSDLTQALALEFGQAQERAERQAEARERTAEYEREQAEAERQARRDAKREAREQEQAAGRKAITSGPPAGAFPQVPVNGIGMAAVQISRWVSQARAEKERKLAEYGPCGYKHREQEVSSRRYWIMQLDWNGNDTGYTVSSTTPQVVVCAKHYKLADAWIEEQAAGLKTHGLNVKAVYTELT